MTGTRYVLLSSRDGEKRYHATSADGLHAAARTDIALLEFIARHVTPVDGGIAAELETRAQNAISSGDVSLLLRAQSAITQALARAHAGGQCAPRTSRSISCCVKLT